MALDIKKFKLKENKSGGDLSAPKYMVSFNQLGKEVENKENSYQIISALKQDNDVFIEINSSMLNLTKNMREDCALTFLKAVRAAGLDYRYRKVDAAGGKSLLSQLFSFGGKQSQAHDVLVYVPDEVWKSGDFQKYLPTSGVKYLVCKDKMDGIKVLDDMYNGQILDDEILDMFKFMIFDCNNFGQMGIYTNSVSMQEMKQLLGF